MVDVDDDPIELVSSNYEDWCEQFTAERDRIHATLSANVLDAHIKRIEHVGSTAVPDLTAKDIVDLDVVVSDGAVSDVSQALEAEWGGKHVKNSDQWQPVFRIENGQRFNDHVFAVSSDRWKISVVTRDVLRMYPHLRSEYEQLKHDLADTHDDLSAYSEGKTQFIRRVLDTARRDDLPYEFTVPSL